MPSFVTFDAFYFSIWPKTLSFERCGSKSPSNRPPCDSTKVNIVKKLSSYPWFSSWFLISKINIQCHQKDTLDLAIHSSCLKAQNDRGCLRFNQVLSREFKVKSPPPPPPPPQPSKCLRGMLSLANGPQTLQ